MAGKAGNQKSAAVAAEIAVQDGAHDGTTAVAPVAELKVAPSDQVAAIEATHIRVRAVPRDGFRRAGHSFGPEWTEIDLDELDEVQVDQLLTERNLVCEFLVKDEAEA